MQSLNEGKKPVKKLYVSLSELEEQERGPVYVLNNTRQPEQGQVCFTVPKLGQSGVDQVVVPSTFIPINLMDQVSRKQLKESSEFKSAVRGKVLILVSDSYAAELLADEDAEFELERLFNIQQANRNLAQSLDDIQTGDMLHPEFANRQRMLDNPDNDTEEGVNPRVAAVVGRVLEDSDERGAISSLRMLENLTSKDYTYIIRQCGKRFGNLTAWATKRV